MRVGWYRVRYLTRGVTFLAHWNGAGWSPRVNSLTVPDDDGSSRAHGAAWPVLWQGRLDPMAPRIPLGSLSITTK